MDLLNYWHWLNIIPDYYYYYYYYTVNKVILLTKSYNNCSIVSVTSTLFNIRYLLYNFIKQLLLCLVSASSSSSSWIYIKFSCNNRHTVCLVPLGHAIVLALLNAIKNNLSSFLTSQAWEIFNKMYSISNYFNLILILCMVIAGVAVQ